MQEGKSSCSAAAFWHFDGSLQGDLACRHARKGSNLVRSHKQSRTGTGQHLDGRLNFAGDVAGDSIDGSLTSESGQSRQAQYQGLEVLSFRRGAKIRYQSEKNPKVLLGKSWATVNFSLQNDILPAYRLPPAVSKGYSYGTATCVLNSISPARDCSA